MLRVAAGRCVLGFQPIAQVSTVCGAGDAQTIVENCGSTLILRCSSTEGGGTSRLAPRLIGEGSSCIDKSPRGTPAGA